MVRQDHDEYLGTDVVLYTAAEAADARRLNHQVVQRSLHAGGTPADRIRREWRDERGQRGQRLAWLERRTNPRRDPVECWFGADGRLLSLAATRSLSGPVLERLAGECEPRRSYREQEVTAVLHRFHSDVASPRREMAAEQLVVRSRAGVYQRVSAAESLLRRA